MYGERMDEKKETKTEEIESIYKKLSNESLDLVLLENIKFHKSHQE